MATISGTALTYGSGSTQSTAGGRVISYGFAKYSNRESGIGGNSNYVQWTGAQMTRKRTDTYIRATAMLPGHGRYNYPLGGCFCQLVRPDNSTLRRWIGTLHQPCLEGDGQEVIWFTDYTWSPTDIGSQLGLYRLQFGMQTSNGNEGKWANIWNPSKSDDNRGYQKGSVSFIEEIYYG